MIHYLLIGLHKFSIQVCIVHIQMYTHVYMCVYVYAYIHRYMCVAKCFNNYFAGPVNRLEFQFMDISFLKCITLTHFYRRLYFREYNTVTKPQTNTKRCLASVFQQRSSLIASASQLLSISLSPKLNYHLSLLSEPLPLLLSKSAALSSSPALVPE